MYRAGFIQNASISQAYGKNAIHSIANIPQMSNGSSSAYYNSVLQHSVQQSHQNSANYFGHMANRNASSHRYSKAHHQQQQHDVSDVFLFFGSTIQFQQLSILASNGWLSVESRWSCCWFMGCWWHTKSQQWHSCTHQSCHNCSRIQWRNRIATHAISGQSTWPSSIEFTIATRFSWWPTC